MQNPNITPLLRGLTLIETIVLFIAGCGLFFLPQVIGPKWPWALAPFNMRFMGGVYVAAMVAAAIQTVSGRWSPTRVVTPMIFLFTAIFFVLSLVYLDRFDLQRPIVWIWFFLYFILPVNAAYHLWRYRDWPAAEPKPAIGMSRTVLWGQTAVLGFYGLALLFFPTWAAAFWPWKLDSFHAQLYSVTFLTPALGGYLLIYAGSRNEWLTMGVAQSILGFFPLVGLFWVDAAVKRVAWSAPGTWVWLCLFGAMFLAGLWMLWKAKAPIAISPN